MHIPDGYLSTPVWASLNLVSVPAVGWMARRARLETDESRLPLLGVMGAFVFAAQLVNFPVGVGTSGHLLGSALLAMTLGPAAASIVMTAILFIQALVFQDGGVLALGANVFNMAILGVLGGYLPYQLWGTGRARRVAIFAGGALSVLIGACLAFAQLFASGVAMPRGLVLASLVLFGLTAAIEGAVTLAVFEAIERLNPSWVQRPGQRNRAVGLLAALALALGLAGAVWASASPDVLESFAEQAGIASHARSLVTTPFGDYEWSLFQSNWLRKSSAGLVGLTIIYLFCLAGARLLRRRQSH